MIGYLSGKIKEVAPQQVLLVIDGGSATGQVGYLVTVPDTTRSPLFEVGRQAEFYIYTHVREDALELFGFASLSEKELFLSLLSVNGIGPKMAISILAGAEPAHLIQSIIQGNVAELGRLPGIGKKKAERLVLELSESLAKKRDLGLFKGLLQVQRPKALNLNDSESSAILDPPLEGWRSSGAQDPLVRDATLALVGLGYRLPEIERWMSEMASDPDLHTVEDRVRRALQLGRGMGHERN